MAPCTKRSAMLILGAIRSFRASGLNLFSRPKFLRLRLPKRFGLWMSRDCACFLFRLRNAGAYIPKGTPCTLHVSTTSCATYQDAAHAPRSPHFLARAARLTCHVAVQQRKSTHMGLVHRVWLKSRKPTFRRKYTKQKETQRPDQSPFNL